jgi:tetratricopeptide (TPR) repeat protein
VLWPLLRRREHSAPFLALPNDAREQLMERRQTVFRALRELDFEHTAGHVSDDDYADLKSRYETEAGAILTELDRLGPAPTPPAPVARPEATRAGRGWRHPLAIGVSAAALVVFGVALGAGITRFTTPDTNPPMGGPPALPPPMTGGEPAGPGATGAPRAVTPEMMQGMLQAARESLFAERYGEAIAAYQAVLKRDPKNVDALTHLGLIVAIGGHADQALDTIGRALAIDPDYGPALLYRGQILWENKQDAPEAIRAWEHFLKVVPTGEDHDRVAKMITDARAAKPSSKR